ncbi:MAG: hypothetical protein IJI43_03520 [Bacilli bacterium]|nr:hypothetical protein [Bacilli bacterium]
MEVQDTYRYLVGGYYGVSMIDEYPLKEYMLIEIDKYIDDYVKTNQLEDFDYIGERLKIKETYSDRVKLQDSLLLLQRMSAPMDLVFLVKARLKKLGKKDYFN